MALTYKRLLGALLLSGFLVTASFHSGLVSSLQLLIGEISLLFLIIYTTVVFQINQLINFSLIACYSFIFLFLENYGVRKLEAFFAVLIGVMALSFAWMFGEAKPNGVDVLVGEFLLGSTIHFVPVLLLILSFISLYIRGLYVLVSTHFFL